MAKIIMNKMFDYKVHHDNMNIIEAYAKKQQAKHAKKLAQAYDYNKYNKYLDRFEQEDLFNENLGLLSINR
jgi:predicted kinase